MLRRWSCMHRNGLRFQRTVFKKRSLNWRHSQQSRIRQSPGCFGLFATSSLNASRSARRRANHERLAAALSSPLVFEKQWSDERESLAAALSNLSSDDRELIVLRVWSGLTWQQVAELTRTSSSSAQRNYVVALKKLREILEPSCQKNLKFRPT